MQANGLVHRLVLIAALAAITSGPAFAQRCATSAEDEATSRGVPTAVSAAVTAAPKPGLAAPSRLSRTLAAPTRDDSRKGTPAGKSPRPTIRAKASTPHAPAAPGMGSLLKWTTGAGRDVSSLFDGDDKNDRGSRIIAGRATHTRRAAASPASIPGGSC